jgi:hypothetical protein
MEIEPPVFVVASPEETTTRPPETFFPLPTIRLTLPPAPFVAEPVLNVMMPELPSLATPPVTKAIDPEEPLLPLRAVFRLKAPLEFAAPYPEIKEIEPPAEYQTQPDSPLHAFAVDSVWQGGLPSSAPVPMQLIGLVAEV